MHQNLNIPQARFVNFALKTRVLWAFFLKPWLATKKGCPMFPESCPTNTSQAHFTTLLNVSSFYNFGTCDYSYFELSRYINETTIVRIKVAMKLHR